MINKGMEDYNKYIKPESAMTTEELAEDPVYQARMEILVNNAKNPDGTINLAKLVGVK